MLLLIFTVLAGISRQQAHDLITHPLSDRDPIIQTPADYGMENESLTLTSSDGLMLAGWYIPSHNGAAVIVVHGYKGDRSGMLPQASILAAHGYGVLLIDLRAHGQSEGEMISFGKYEVRDLEAAYQYLLTRPDIDPQRIGLLGDSLGGTVALLYAAQNPDIKATVADSAFASLQDSIGKGVEKITHLPALPFAPLIEFFAEQEAHSQASEVSALEHIGQISPNAVFLLQGGQDDFIPTDSGQRLYDAAGEPRILWFDEALGHTNFVSERRDEYERRVIVFFGTYLLDQ